MKAKYHKQSGENINVVLTMGTESNYERYSIADVSISLGRMAAWVQKEEALSKVPLSTSDLISGQTTGEPGKSPTDDAASLEASRSNLC